MVLSTQPQSILMLSFLKANPEMAFFDFEKLLVYNVMQILAYYSDIQLLDHAVPANRIMLANQDNPRQIEPELQQVGEKLGAKLILYGSMEPEIDPGGYLDDIIIRLNLYDAYHGHHLFQLQYAFNAFESKQPTIKAFTPTWNGLSDLSAWMVLQILSAVNSQEAMRFIKRTQPTGIALNLEQLQKLSTAHYLNSADSFSRKYALLQELILEDSHLYVAFLEMGQLQKRQQKYVHAAGALEWAYKEMLDVTPRQRALTATEIGVCHALNENTDKACMWWKTAICDDPHLINPYLNLGHELEEQSNLEEAEQFFVQASHIARHDSRIYYNLARIYSKQQHWDHAIRQYDQLIMMEPENAWLIGNIANCYLQKGDMHTAKRYLRQTVEIDPSGEAGQTAGFILSELQAIEGLPS